MSTRTMHAGEIGIDEALVRRLIVAQFPQWSHLPLRPVPSTGTINAMYRLGDGMVVRLPRVEWAIEGLHREMDWLPLLAPRLPVPVPVLLGRGVPADGYPWPWCIYRWLEGDVPRIGAIASPQALAMDLVAFIVALQGVDPAPGPPSDQSLAINDDAVRAAIVALGGTIDRDAAMSVWEACMAAPAWTGPPVWLHGDLSPGNVLVAGGRLRAVIDFSAVGVGDPAGDLRVAWNLLPAEVRDDFRAAIGVDDATWARARGKALAQALIHLRYYRETNPVLAANARHVIRDIVREPALP